MTDMARLYASLPSTRAEIDAALDTLTSQAGLSIADAAKVLIQLGTPTATAVATFGALRTQVLLRLPPDIGARCHTAYLERTRR